MDIGTAEISSNTIEGKAALAKKASDDNDQMEVVSVWKSKGASNKTAGSSFIVIKNTVAKAIRMPGFINGNVVFAAAINWDFPSVLAESSNRGLICRIEVFTEPIPAGINRIAQPTSIIQNDW